MKFLHTADWQLGKTPKQLGGRAAEARALRFETAERVAQVARDEVVDFVVLAGDTFENEDLGTATIRRAVEILDSLRPIPVYVLPGNHDPIRPGGIWDSAHWNDRGDHIHLLDERAEIEVDDGVVLLPSPLDQKRSGRDPTAWMPEADEVVGNGENGENDQRIRIGVAHGGLDTLPDDSPSFPIAADRAKRAGLDYLALGDWHGLKMHGETAYPGTIEPSSFGEDDPGYVLSVEIDEPGSEPSIEPIPVRELTWISDEHELRDETDIAALRSELDALADTENLVARLELRAGHGADETIREAVRALDEDFRETAFYWDVAFDESALYDERELEVPSGILSSVREDLEAILDGRIPEGPGREFAGEDEEVVREARRLLFRAIERESE